MAVAATLTLLMVGIGCAQGSPFESEGSSTREARSSEALEEPEVGPDVSVTARLLIRSVKQRIPKHRLSWPKRSKS